MNTNEPRYSMEEFARRGEQLYWDRVDALVKDLPPRTVVAIDIESGNFETADDIRTAYQLLQSRVPGAQIWSVRIGHQPIHHFGPRERNI